ncbi:MAG: hypothetical protein AUI14_24510 [Actinobacteria bacterium 13_2_20CM_2_71_6]|nr:MAG: hypothetical protein AUI14_24510 [Actinobacteria bacterium 13_2_20CM_2_71_6]
MGRQEQPLDPEAGPLQTFAYDLRQLRRATGSPGYRTLARRAGYSASRTGEVSVLIPRQLPLDAFGFTGRAAELAELDAVLDTAGRELSAVVISAVSGTGGVGKTALAVHWAQRVAHRFPGGQLYVDLRGYDPDQPLDPADVLSGFLRALGVPGNQVPYDVAERAARYRTLVAGRRMLVLLDNAHSADQVRLLLPGTPSCFVVVTSRDSLAGLVARHGALRLDLDLLPSGDAVALLRTLVGARIDAEPAAAVALAQRCARLPLALRLAAEIAVARPSSTVEGLAAELADEHRRLDLLDAGADGRTAVRGVFSWSYRRLPEPAARLFRLLGLHPGQDIDSYAVAALAGEQLDRARSLADVLVRAHLVDRTPDQRLRMHDLLRAYAAELAEREPASARDAASTRLLDHYLATAAAAVDTLFPADRDRRPRIAAPDNPMPPVADPAHAKAWLDAERANLFAIAAYAAGNGRPEHVDQLVGTLARHLESVGRYTDTLALYGHALQAARASGDVRAEGDAQLRLGNILCNLGRHVESAEHYQQALAIRRAIGDEVLIGRTLNNLGNLYQRWGRHAEAADHFRQALASQEAAGDRYGQGVVLCNLGDLYVASGGPYREALDCYERAVAQFRDIEDRSCEGNLLGFIAFVLVRLGRYGEAVEQARHALALLREVGDQHGECYALSSLALARVELGSGEEAVAYVEQSLRLARELGDRMAVLDTLNAVAVVYQRTGRYRDAYEQLRLALALAQGDGYRTREIVVLNGLGEALRALGHPDEARRYYAAALRLARELDNADQQARALSGIAYIRRAAGRLALAREAWCAALDRYTELAVPEADEVRALLAAVDATTVGAM